MHSLFFNIIFLGLTSSSTIPVELSIGDLLANSGKGFSVQTQGWVTFRTDISYICEERSDPKSSCILLEFMQVNPSADELMEHCLIVNEWYNRFHGKRIVIRGVFVSGRSGFQGVFPAKFVTPEFVSGPESLPAPRDFTNHCKTILGKSGVLTYNE